MDFLYVLGRGSKWNNNELKYSIRSLVKHVSCIERILIVGEDPGFLKFDDRCIHIPFKDKFTPAQNIWHKVNEACNIFTESFIFMNDDYFLLKDFNCFSDKYVDIPYYYNSELSDRKRIAHNNNYSNLIIKTHRALERNKLPIKYFDIHFPIVIQPIIFRGLFKKYFEEIKFGQGILMKSIYCNELKVHGIEIPDVKITSKLLLEQIKKRLADEVLFSISDAALNDEMKKFLELKFPNKSEYEL